MSHAGSVSRYIDKLVNVRPNRRTGSVGNRRATRFFADTIRSWGYDVDTTPFEVMDYKAGPATVQADGESIDLNTGPYSMPVSLTAPAVVVTSAQELEALNCSGMILLLAGEICHEQLMPKNFVFYNPDHHKKIYRVLEEKQPVGIITATGRNPEVGALYPYPLFVDGDFDIPHAFCTDVVGDRLAALTGGVWTLEISGIRSPATASNVIARLNATAKNKVTITAHIDAYEESPGASDNASGTAALLVIGELLADYRGDMGVEILAINGEDHYSAAGEMDYLNRFGSEMDSVRLLVNIDDIGFVQGTTSFSTYECSSDVEQLVDVVFSSHPGIQRGESWYAGDHMVFVQAGRPAVAFTATLMPRLMETVTHTEADTADLLDPEKIVEVAGAVADLVRRL